MTVRKLSPTRASQTGLGIGAGFTGLATGATTTGTGVGADEGKTFGGAITATGGVTGDAVGFAGGIVAEVAIALGDGGLAGATAPGEAGGVHPVAEGGVDVGPNTTGARGVGIAGAGDGVDTEPATGTERAGGIAPGWFISTQSPVGKANFGAELHPTSKAAQSSSLAKSLQFMTSTYVEYE